MKTKLIKKYVQWMILGVFFLNFSSFGQTTATENFEDEFTCMASNSSTKLTFSDAPSGTAFSLTNKLQVRKNGTFGANTSCVFLESSTAIANEANLGPIAITTAGTSFKINSFAAYLSTNNGSTQAAGSLTFIGTTPSGSTLTETVSVGTNSNKPVNGIVFIGNLLNQQLVSLRITLIGGVNYVELDDINYTTAIIPTNQFSINNVSTTEGNIGTKTVNFTVTRNVSAGTANLNFATADGTAAVSGTDYVSNSGTVNFANGIGSQSVSVVVNGDNNSESNENFAVNLSNPSVGYSILSTVGTGSILDDDNVIETFETEVSNATTFSENTFSFTNNGSILVTRRNGLGSGGSNVFLSTPTAGPFLQGNVGGFQITNPGMVFILKNVDLWTANVTGTSPNFVYTPTSGIVTFTGTKADGSGTVVYFTTISPNSNAHIPVNFAGTPLAGVSLSGVTFTLSGGSPAINYLQIDNLNYSINYLTDTQVYINDVSVLEGTGAGNTTATFTITRTSNLTNFSVNVASANGTATAGSDYTAVPTTTLNFTSGGALTQTLNVIISKDVTIEPNETFFINLSSATNGTIILKSQGIGTILDDDAVCETYEDETDLTTTFSQNSVIFSTTGDWRVRKSNTFGSNSSNGFLSSGTSAGTGNVGKIIITSPNTAFNLTQIDAWTAIALPNYAVGQVTFTGTRFCGGTVSVTKTITPTNNGGAGYQNISFIGTALENVALTELDITLVGSLAYIDVDNFCFSVINTSLLVGTWTGNGGDNNWHTSNNWCGNIIPTATSNVVVPAGVMINISSANAICRSLLLNAGSSIPVSLGRRLDVKGN